VHFTRTANLISHPVAVKLNAESHLPAWTRNRRRNYAEPQSISRWASRQVRPVVGCKPVRHMTSFLYQSLALDCMEVRRTKDYCYLRLSFYASISDHLQPAKHSQFNKSSAKVYCCSHSSEMYLRLTSTGIARSKNTREKTDDKSSMNLSDSMIQYSLKLRQASR
jgi:hypothetical protein